MKSFAARLGAFSLVASSIVGCATITTGADQSVTIVTDPSGAECQLDRAGSSIAIVNPTPGTVQVDKSKDAITILCKADGYQPTIATLASEFQGMTVGNVIFGGIIGVAVDAGSGAMNQYPSQITLLLVPESFATGAERDAFFDAAIARANARTAEAVAKVQSKCVDDDGCKREVSIANATGESEVAQLKSQWVSAKVRY